MRISTRFLKNFREYLESCMKLSYIRSHNQSHESNMKLSKSVAKRLGAEKSKNTRTRLALELNFTERWVLKLIQENKPNGPLTTMAALNVIKADTGMEIHEILEAKPISTL